MSLQQLTVTNQAFLAGIFGEHAPFTHIASFPEDPSQLDALGKRGVWGGGVAYSMDIEIAENNNFFTISTFRQNQDGEFRRQKMLFRGCFCIMVDDIGDGPGAKIDEAAFRAAGAPDPSWINETSTGNCQWGYILEYPEQTASRVNALQQALVALDLVEGGGDPGLMGVTRYARLPVGTNNKAKYGQPFRHRLLHWAPETKYTLDTLADSFGITLAHYETSDGSYTEPLDAGDDPVLAALVRQGLYKFTKEPGAYDITCPWHLGHTDQLNNGSMYFSPNGYRCHHGSCEARTGRDLMNYLHGVDEEYRQACEVTIPFEPVRETLTPEVVETPIPIEEPEPTPTQARITRDSVIEKIGKLGASTPPEVVVDICKDIASGDFDPTTCEYFYVQIKATNYKTGLKVLRDEVMGHRRTLQRARVNQGLIGSPTWGAMQTETQPKANVENFRAMVDFHGIRIRWNQMSHDIEAVIPGRTFSSEDRENLELRFLKDLMIGYDLNYTDCADFMNYVGHENAYHPFVEYLDAADDSKYDYNCPMFAKLLNTIGMDCDRDEAEIFIRKWLISVVAAVRGHCGQGMKGCLVFTGEQNIGKTSWLRYLTPHGMFGEGIHLDPHNKDTIITATSYLICELGELDSTLKRDIAAVKSIISNVSDVYRVPYARKKSTTVRRTVFGGTVNQSDFLRDGTGNSRFWPVAVKSFDLGAMADMVASGEIQQMWHEIDRMYTAFMDGHLEFDWRLGIYDDAGHILQRLTREHQEDSPVKIMLEEKYDFDSPLVDLMTMSEILLSIGLNPSQTNSGVSRQVRDVIFINTGQGRSKHCRRDGEKGRFFKMPKATLTTFTPRLSVVSSGSPDYDFL